MSSIHPEVQIGHVHLKVADIERSLKLYRDILGFEIMAEMPGRSAVFLSAGGYHHHIALNTWESEHGTPPPSGHTGLYHFAILYPDRKELAEALRQLIAADYPIQGASDHGVSEAIYLEDPDGNGVELYCDRAKDEWPVDSSGKLAFDRPQPLDLEALLAEEE